MKHTSFLIFILTLLLAACGKPPQPTPTAVEPSPTAIEPTPTVEATGITLTYEDNAQVELVTTAGRTIYIDVGLVNNLTKQPSADDILLTTHSHEDHYVANFQKSFPGQQICMTVGRIELPDVTITSIPSAHLPEDTIQADKASNYIFIIETGGLRIVHFGDIGQDALLDDQLAAIGSVDLAISQLNNSFSLMDATNLRGFNLMDQVKPRLILPTHSDRATIEIAVGRWTGFYSGSRTVTITPANLPETTGILVLGNESLIAAYAKMYNLQEWK